ncbi:hypothetical protein [Spiribacter roseus]|uniref:Transferrin-binding protein B C-lobe/N-lobe beta barrel domain-containing protein n=1 Tax=Spiribacter roseus TaxID=1855875 RepID=A0ABV3RX40_9GAMM
MAQEAETTVDAYVGLTEAYKVECTDVHFGVWRVDIGADSYSGATISLTGNVSGSSVSSSAVSDDTDNLALSVDAPDFDNAAVGECEVNGAPVTSPGSLALHFGDTTATAGANTSTMTYNGVVDAADYAFGTIDGPTSEPTIDITGELAFVYGDGTVDANPADGGVAAAGVNANGESLFANTDGGFLIGGIVTLPDGLNSDNLGGYKATGTTVVVDSSS